MPKRPPMPCTHPMCKKYAVKNSRCINHQKKAWASNDGKSRHERGYGNDWDKLRKMILRRDGFLCKPCQHNNRLTKASQVDHITPKARGGTNSEGNLQSICNDCHKTKTQSEARHGR